MSGTGLPRGWSNYVPVLYTSRLFGLRDKRGLTIANNDSATARQQFGPYDTTITTDLGGDITVTADTGDIVLEGTNIIENGTVVIEPKKLPGVWLLMKGPCGLGPGEFNMRYGGTLSSSGSTAVSGTMIYQGVNVFTWDRNGAEGSFIRSLVYGVYSLTCNADYVVPGGIKWGLWRNSTNNNSFTDNLPDEGVPPFALTAQTGSVYTSNAYWTGVLAPNDTVHVKTDLDPAEIQNLNKLNGFEIQFLGFSPTP